MRKTMSRNEALASRLREVLLNGHWIANTNFKEQIQSIHWKQAIHKAGTFNSIAALTYHINYYLSGILHAMASGELTIRDQFSFDLPPIESEENWRSLVEEFIIHSERLANLVEQMGEAQLDQPFFDQKYGTYERNIEGVIEHSYYHLGQISLIRKYVEQLST
jgi:hypothetical protein